MLFSQILHDSILDYLSTPSQKAHKKAFSALSEGYRQFNNARLGSRKEEVDAYLLGRMPLTWAVLVQVLALIVPNFQKGFSVVDFGSGPGTALWALNELFSDLPIDYLGMEAKPAMIEAAEFLATRQSTPCKFILQSVETGQIPKKDLAIVSYLLNELRHPDLFFQRLFAAADTLVIIEPGTPDGYQRLIELRDKALLEGFQVVAPCPHQKPCPMKGTKWCHFSLRVPRTKMMRAIKEASLGYEDEKYSYLILSKNCLALHTQVIVDRPHNLGFGIAFNVCDASGDLKQLQVLKKDKALFAEFKKKQWGDFI